MGTDWRKGGVIAGAGTVLLGVLLGWAYYDGGTRPVTLQSAPALLPPVGR